MDWRTALSDPDALRARGLFLAEGRLVLGRILAGAAGGAPAIVSVLSTPAAGVALDLLARVGDRLTTRNPAEMEAITGFNFHRGVLALVHRPPTRTLTDVIASALQGPDDRTEAAERGPAGRAATSTQEPEPEARHQGSGIQYPAARTWHPAPRPRASVSGGPYPAALVVAERLVDVDNVGSCFRNAHALGAACVLLDERCPDPLYRKAVRTSLGTVLEVPWVQAPIRDLMDALAAARVITIGLTPDAGAAAAIAGVAAEVGTHAPVALVVGNEGEGLSAATRARCARLARIPMATGADSLNVATALAVALYEWRVRQH